MWMEHPSHQTLMASTLRPSPAMTPGSPDITAFSCRPPKWRSAALLSLCLLLSRTDANLIVSFNIQPHYNNSPRLAWITQSPPPSLISKQTSWHLLKLCDSNDDRGVKHMMKMHSSASFNQLVPQGRLNRSRRQLRLKLLPLQSRRGEIDAG